MIEKVKEFGAELYPQTLTDVCVLDHGEISIVETRADDHVAAQTSKMRHGSEYRSVEPAIYFAYGFYGTSNIRSHRVSHAVERAVAGHDVYRTPALRLNDCG